MDIATVLSSLTYERFYDTFVVRSKTRPEELAAFVDDALGTCPAIEELAMALEIQRAKSKRERKGEPSPQFYKGALILLLTIIGLAEELELEATA